ncbi:MAG: S16 family serine protease [Haloplanus sp.]
MHADTSSVAAVERAVLDRRRFLKGVGVGGIAFGGARVAGETPFRAMAALTDSTAVPSRTTHDIPAVDGTDEGILITVSVAFTDNRDGLFVNLNRVEVRHDLQVALREAATAARKLTGSRPPAPGILITFTAAGDGVIGLRGKSWEAGLTVVLAAALAGVSLDPETLVTGVVADDGSLLPVGGIEAKATAARESGAGRLLVPEGQAETVPGIDIEAVADIEAALDTVLNG